MSDVVLELLQTAGNLGVGNKNLADGVREPDGHGLGFPKSARVVVELGQAEDVAADLGNCDTAVIRRTVCTKPRRQIVFRKWSP